MPNKEQKKQKSSKKNKPSTPFKNSNVNKNQINQNQDDTPKNPEYEGQDPESNPYHDIQGREF